MTQIQTVPIKMPVSPAPGPLSCFLTAKAPPAPAAPLFLGRIQVIVGTAPNGVGSVMPGSATALGGAKIFRSSVDYASLVNLIASGAPFSVDIKYDDLTNIVETFRFFSTGPVAVATASTTIHKKAGTDGDIV